MKVLQLIDSLRPGGAEQMAVAYANAFSRGGYESFLCCTRMEGLLKKRLKPEVRYLYLDKKYLLDWGAFRRLRNFVKVHHVQVIQAHSSSWFLAVLIKLSVPGIKLVWHDHYGRNLEERNDIPLKLMSRFFDGIISVNEALKVWARMSLKSKNVLYINNFLPPLINFRSELKLQGSHSIKIICVANLRPQKDHLNLLKAFTKLLSDYPDLSLHLVGKDEENDYSRELKSLVVERNLEGNVFLYGEQDNAELLMSQANIGVLASSSEGLPVVLLEYGRNELPVVSTDVGNVSEVLKSFGIIVKPRDSEALAEGLRIYLDKPQKREEDAILFHRRVLRDFSEAEVLARVVNFYRFIGVRERKL